MNYANKMNKGNRTRTLGTLLIIVWELRDMKPLKINTISKRTGICWQSVKDSLEVLETLGIIDYHYKDKHRSYVLDTYIKKKLSRKGGEFIESLLAEQKKITGEPLEVRGR